MSRWALLVAAVLALTGCLQSTVGVLAAPQAVAGMQAARLVGQAGEAVDAASAVSDLDRILARHPEADNADELRGLRDQLAKQGTTQTGRPAPTEPGEFDRRARHPLPTRDRPRLRTPKPTGEDEAVAAQRAEPRMFTTARTSSLRPEERRWYGMQVTPVRLSPTFAGEPSSERRP